MNTSNPLDILKEALMEKNKRLPISNENRTKM